MFLQGSAKHHILLWHSEVLACTIRPIGEHCGCGFPAFSNTPAMAWPRSLNRPRWETYTLTCRRTGTDTTAMLLMMRCIIPWFSGFPPWLLIWQLALNQKALEKITSQHEWTCRINTFFQDTHINQRQREDILQWKEKIQDNIDQQPFPVHWEVVIITKMENLIRLISWGGYSNDPDRSNWQLPDFFQIWLEQISFIVIIIRLLWRWKPHQIENMGQLHCGVWQRSEADFLLIRPYLGS